MKRLNLTSFTEGNYLIMDRRQLRNTVGGSGDMDMSSCYTTCICDDGVTTFKISINPCTGNWCVATKEESVTCGQETVKCSDGNSTCP